MAGLWHATGLLLACLAVAGAAAAITNGDFENGIEGWEWYQCATPGCYGPLASASGTAYGATWWRETTPDAGRSGDGLRFGCDSAPNGYNDPGPGHSNCVMHLYQVMAQPRPVTLWLKLEQATSTNRQFDWWDIDIRASNDGKLQRYQFYANAYQEGVSRPGMHVEEVATDRWYHRCLDLPADLGALHGREAQGPTQFTFYVVTNIEVVEAHIDDVASVESCGEVPKLPPPPPAPTVCPTFTAPGMNVTLEEGTQGAWDLPVSDPDDTPLSWTWAATGPGMAASGPPFRFTADAREAVAGLYEQVLTLSPSNECPPQELPVAVTVTAPPVPPPPPCPARASTVVTVHYASVDGAWAYDIPLAPSGPLQTVSWSVSPPAGMRATHDPPRITWTPGAEQAGTHLAAVRLWPVDAACAPVSYQFTIIVPLPPPDPPPPPPTPTPAPAWPGVCPRLASDAAYLVVQPGEEIFIQIALREGGTTWHRLDGDGIAAFPGIAFDSGAWTVRWIPDAPGRFTGSIRMVTGQPSCDDRFDLTVNVTLEPPDKALEPGDGRTCVADPPVPDPSNPACPPAEPVRADPPPRSMEPDEDAGQMTRLEAGRDGQGRPTASAATQVATPADRMESPHDVPAVGAPGPLGAAALVAALALQRKAQARTQPIAFRGCKS